MSKTITVAQLNRYVNAVLGKDSNLNPVRVEGEISGFRSYPSGHLYFTLKDEKSAVSCVMFKGHTRNLRFRPENGNKVVVTAKAAIYDRDGRFQLYVYDMTASGVGDLHLAFEQLKKKLQEEGLFAAERKQKPPLLPRKIGVVTSSSGAVIRDILQVLQRRFPGFHLQLIPVPVQGDEAAPAIAGALRRFNELGEVDVIIVGRGGGSLEDLWAFNEESVARAVAASTIPVISAVGHETDQTICDFVADLRAPTPSAAAELAMPVKQEQLLWLDAQTNRLSQALKKQLKWHWQHLSSLKSDRVFRQPLERIERHRLDLDHSYRRLQQAASHKLEGHQRQLSVLSGKLDALSPLKVLARGYGMVKSVPDGRAVRSTALMKPGDRIEVWLSDGTLGCKVDSVQDRRNER